MQSLRKLLHLLLLGALLTGLAACSTIMPQSQTGDIQASGIVEATQILISSEMSGRVAEVFVQLGDSVQPNDPLFRLEDDLLTAQRDQATAALAAAQANLDAARTGLTSAQAALQSAQAGADLASIQYQQELAAARTSVQPTRKDTWNASQPTEFTAPPWYFNQSEEIQAAQTEVQAAQDAMAVEQQNYDQLIQDASYKDLQDTENRLADAQAAFLVAQDLKTFTVAQNGRDKIDNYVEKVYQNAKAELERVQKEYDALLSDTAYSDVLEARARLAVAKQRYEVAQDKLDALLTGENALSVKAAAAAETQAKAGVTQAQAGVDQAQSAITQAEKAIAQAQADLDLVNLQISKLTINTPLSGVVMTRDIQPGEVLQPGVTAITLGELDQLKITVYIPEDQYGRVSLGQHAKVTADSFPGVTFDAVVSRIADQAEFTPRNVQTKEDRSTTVYAVELSLTASESQLKPGMPVDVDFTP
jgi:HlyD family secretion protein